MPLATCVRQTDDPLVWQAVFGYVSTSSSDLTVAVAQDANWLRSADDTNQPQPTTFLANQMFSRAFDVLFSREDEVQWTLAAAANTTRQTAVLNRHSHLCDVDLYSLDTVQPHLYGCIQRMADQCTAHFGYTNPNPQTIELPIGFANRFSPEPLDRRQPRIFWPGHVDDAFDVKFDCSSDAWALSWTLMNSSIASVGPFNLCQ